MGLFDFPFLVVPLLVDPFRFVILLIFKNIWLHYKKFINSHEKKDFVIFPTKSIISYNMGTKLGGSDLRYGFSYF